MEFIINLIKIIAIIVACVLLGIFLLKDASKKNYSAKAKLNDRQKNKLQKKIRLRYLTDEQKKKIFGDRLKDNLKTFVFFYLICSAIFLLNLLSDESKIDFLVIILGGIGITVISVLVLQYFIRLNRKYCISDGYFSGFYTGISYRDRTTKGRYYYYDPRKDRYRSVVFEIPNDITYRDQTRKEYYEMIILDSGNIYRPIMLLPKSMWEEPQSLGTSFRLLNVHKAQLNNELTNIEQTDTETLSVQSSTETQNNPRENRTPLGEQPHYKMLGNLMQLSGWFHHLKREYLAGRSDEKELSEITTQPLLHSLVVQRNRLDKLGISLDEELSNAVSDLQFQSDGYNMSTMQNDRDEYGIRNRLYYVQRNVYKDGKCIYKHKEQEMSTISVLRSKVDSENTTCPNCGYQGKLSDFMNGCQACGTHFYHSRLRTQNNRLCTQSEFTFTV